MHSKTSKKGDWIKNYCQNKSNKRDWSKLTNIHASMILGKQVVKL